MYTGTSTYWFLLELATNDMHVVLLRDHVYFVNINKLWAFHIERFTVAL
jgi:hypothetical protein